MVIIVIFENLYLTR